MAAVEGIEENTSDDFDLILGVAEVDYRDTTAASEAVFSIESAQFPLEMSPSFLPSLPSECSTSCF